MASNKEREKPQSCEQKSKKQKQDTIPTSVLTMLCRRMNIPQKVTENKIFDLVLNNPVNILDWLNFIKVNEIPIEFSTFILFNYKYEQLKEYENICMIKTDSTHSELFSLINKVKDKNSLINMLYKDDNFESHFLYLREPNYTMCAKYDCKNIVDGYQIKIPLGEIVEYDAVYLFAKYIMKTFSPASSSPYLHKMCFEKNAINCNKLLLQSNVLPDDKEIFKGIMQHPFMRGTKFLLPQNVIESFLVECKKQKYHELYFYYLDATI